MTDDLELCASLSKAFLVRKSLNDASLFQWNLSPHAASKVLEFQSQQALLATL